MPPPAPRRTFRRVLAAIALCTVAFFVFLFTACGVLFGVGGVVGGGRLDGVTLLAPGCAVAGATALYWLERVRRRL